MRAGDEAGEYDVTQESFVEYEIPENCVLLNFTSDWIAEAYKDWFYSKGRSAFLKWANSKKKKGRYV